MVRLFSAFVLIAALGTGSARAQASFVTFTVANHFCQKARLGMDPVDAYMAALERVMNKPGYDADYELPNWPRIVSSEMHRLCPVEFSNLLAAEKKASKEPPKAADPFKNTDLMRAYEAANEEQRLRVCQICSEYKDFSYGRPQTCFDNGCK
jgi:hypothetical protein